MSCDICTVCVKCTLPIARVVDEKGRFDELAAGGMSEAGYHRATNELMNFLVYQGKPV